MIPPRPYGIFADLATLDVIHRIDAPPDPDQKITARAQFIAAGGPAANAAVTFSALGGDATGLQAPGPDTATLQGLLEGADVVLLDGRHPTLARALREEAGRAGLQIVLDAGRWKPSMGELVGAVTDVVACADFRPPGRHHDL